MDERHLVVVGGGITGLAAAWEASADPELRVTVLESADRFGGKIRTSDVTLPDGTTMTIDEGADSVPGPGARCRGAVPRARPRRRAHPAGHRHGRRCDLGGELRLLPDGTVLGVPTDMDALAASGLLSEGGLATAAAELDRTDAAPEGDVTIGAFLADRFGAELVDHVVGPLIGGINAGDVEELSLAGGHPPARRGGRRRRQPERGARGSSTRRPRHRTGVPRAAGRFGPTDLGAGGRAARSAACSSVPDAPLRELRRRGDGMGAGRGRGGRRADPGRSGGAHHPGTRHRRAARAALPRRARELAAMTHSACALVTLVYRAEDVPTELDASGFLVPRSEGLFLTAASWGSSKWAHWDDGRHVVLRVSAGRTGDERQADMDDGELVDGLRADLATTMGITAAPVATRVARWELGFTQYTVGHLDRVGRIEQALEQDCPTLAVAGAAYRGLGLPACIHQGRGGRRLIGPAV